MLVPQHNNTRMDKETKAFIEEQNEKLAQMVIGTMATKEHIKEVQSDIAVVKKDVAGVKSDLQEFRHEVNERLNELETGFKWAQQVDELNDRVRVLETTVERMQKAS